MMLWYFNIDNKKLMKKYLPSDDIVNINPK